MSIEYPQWICRSCGVKHGKRKTTGVIATWHKGICDICKSEREVTEPRDFGHLKSDWRIQHDATPIPATESK